MISPPKGSTGDWEKKERKKRREGGREREKREKEPEERGLTMCFSLLKRIQRGERLIISRRLLW